MVTQFLVVIFKLAKKCSTTDNLEGDGYFQWVGMQGFVVGFFLTIWQREENTWISGHFFVVVFSAGT